MNLPQTFIERMKEQLKSEWPDFLASYNNQVVKGIRVNTLKISVEKFVEICPFDIEKVPWTDDGFYIRDEERPAKHPYYFAGLYYIQEPSAMLPAVLLNPDSDSITLDLCAAPGGKTMQLAACMLNKGLLIANDISSNRLRALIRNAELLGLKNLVVLNDDQKNISKQLVGYFDRLLIDAPCSGEGMFKKHDDAINAYGDFGIDTCTAMQSDIVDEAIKMLNGQGELVYSTCTFNTFENEAMVNRMLSNNYMTLVKQTPEFGFVSGIDLEGVLRLYPHRVQGEGHFVAKLKHKGEKNTQNHQLINNKAPELLQEFMDLYLEEPLLGHFKIIKERVFLLPEKMLDFGKLKVVKTGWYLGELKKNRFEPSHAFALGLKTSDFKQVINLSSESIDVEKYLKCETLECEGYQGYNLVSVDGFPIGWGKWDRGRLKNLYPAAWRIS